MSQEFRSCITVVLAWDVSCGCSQTVTGLKPFEGFFLTFLVFVQGRFKQLGLLWHLSVCGFSTWQFQDSLTSHMLAYDSQGSCPETENQVESVSPFWPTLRNPSSVISTTFFWPRQLQSLPNSKKRDLWPHLLMQEYEHYIVNRTCGKGYIGVDIFGKCNLHW